MESAGRCENVGAERSELSSCKRRKGPVDTLSVRVWTAGAEEWGSCERRSGRQVSARLSTLGEDAVSASTVGLVRKVLGRLEC